MRGQTSSIYLDWLTAHGLDKLAETWKVKGRSAVVRRLVALALDDLEKEESHEKPDRG